MHFSFGFATWLQQCCVFNDLWQSCNETIRPSLIQCPTFRFGLLLFGRAGRWRAVLCHLFLGLLLGSVFLLVILVICARVWKGEVSARSRERCFEFLGADSPGGLDHVPFFFFGTLFTFFFGSFSFSGSSLSFSGFFFFTFFPSVRQCWQKQRHGDTADAQNYFWFIFL